MYTMSNTTFNACWDTATVQCHWTKRCHDHVGRCPLPNRTEFIDFCKRDLINNDSSFCLRILLAINLQCRVFFWKAVFKYPSVCKWHFWWCQIWRHYL